MAKSKKVSDSDFYAVAFDETKDYNIDPSDKRYIKAIFGVYIFDKNSHTYAAELTPSYWLEPVYTTIDFTDSDLEMRDHLDQKYAHEGMEGMYVHVHTLDAYFKKHATARGWARRYVHLAVLPTPDTRINAVLDRLTPPLE